MVCGVLLMAGGLKSTWRTMVSQANKLRINFLIIYIMNSELRVLFDRKKFKSDFLAEMKRVMARDKFFEVLGVCVEVRPRSPANSMH